MSQSKKQKKREKEKKKRGGEAKGREEDAFEEGVCATKRTRKTRGRFLRDTDGFWEHPPQNARERRARRGTEKERNLWAVSLARGGNTVQKKILFSFAFPFSSPRARTFPHTVKNTYINGYISPLFRRQQQHLQQGKKNSLRCRDYFFVVCFV